MTPRPGHRCNMDMGTSWCRTPGLLVVPETGWVLVELPPEGLAEGLVGNQLAIECPVARIALGKPPIAREKIGQ